MVRNKLHWDANNAVGLQNKGTLTSPARLSFVLEVSLHYLRPSVIYSVPCDRILQRAYCLEHTKPRTFADDTSLTAYGKSIEDLIKIWKKN